MWDYLYQKLIELLIYITVLYWSFKAFFMVVGIKFTLAGLLKPFSKKKEKKS